MNIYKPYNHLHPFDMGPVDFVFDPETQEWADDQLYATRLN